MPEYKDYLIPPEDYDKRPSLLTMSDVDVVIEDYLNFYLKHHNGEDLETVLRNANLFNRYQLDAAYFIMDMIRLNLEV